MHQLPLVNPSHPGVRLGRLGRKVLLRLVDLERQTNQLVQEGQVRPVGLPVPHFHWTLAVQLVLEVLMARAIR